MLRPVWDMEVEWPEGGMQELARPQERGQGAKKGTEAVKVGEAARGV